MSRSKVLAELRQASRKGDRAALELALAEMRTLAHSPRYWEKYLGLLRSPLARLVDLLVIKQGDRIAHLKGWKLPRPAPAGGARKPRPREAASRRRSRAADAAAATQPSLFDLVHPAVGSIDTGGAGLSENTAEKPRATPKARRRS